MVACRVAIEFVGTPVAGVEQFDRIGKRPAVRAELIGKIAEIVQHAHGHIIERAEMLFDLGGRLAALAGQVAHGGDELGNPRRHGVLDRAHVLLGAAEDLLQQDIGLAQALEQRGRVGAQHGVRLRHLGDGRGRRLLGLFDRALGRPVQFFERPRDRQLGGFGDALGAFLHLAERPRHRSGRAEAGVVDLTGDLLALVQHRLGEDVALGLDGLHGLVGDAADFAGELLALGAQRRNQAVRPVVEQARHIVDALRHGVVDLIGLADHGARHLGAHADQLALGLAGAAPDRVGRGQRGLGEKVGGGRDGAADRLFGGRALLASRSAAVAAVLPTVSLAVAALLAITSLAAATLLPIVVARLATRARSCSSVSLATATVLPSVSLAVETLLPSVSSAAAAALAMVLLSVPALRLSDSGRFRGAAIEAFGGGRARRRALAERLGGIGGELRQRAFGACRIGLDGFRQRLRSAR